jgi:hypothetical protein
MDNNNYGKALSCLNKTLQYTKDYLDVNRDVLSAEEIRTMEKLLDDSRQVLYEGERIFMLECLKTAVSYCKTQYLDSDIDWLPSAACLGLTDEADKFDLLEDFIDNL